jgi:hypothetical protein
MKMQEIRETAHRMGMRTGKMNRTELIRTIQRTEGNYDCFGTPYVKECNQVNCLWHKDCEKTA